MQALFADDAIDFTGPPGHTPKPMTPLAQAVVVLCIAVVSGVLAATLLAVRRLALRAESVLGVVERELRPMLGRVESATDELRDLTRVANDELRRVGLVVRRAEDVSINLSRLISAITSLTQVGQYAQVAAGVKKGVDVFVRRLRAAR